MECGPRVAAFVPDKSSWNCKSPPLPFLPPSRRSDLQLRTRCRNEGCCATRTDADGGGRTTANGAIRRRILTDLTVETFTGLTGIICDLSQLVLERQNLTYVRLQYKCDVQQCTSDANNLMTMFGNQSENGLGITKTVNVTDIYGRTVFPPRNLIYLPRSSKLSS